MEWRESKGWSKRGMEYGREGGREMRVKRGVG